MAPRFPELLENDLRCNTEYVSIKKATEVVLSLFRQCLKGKRERHKDGPAHIMEGQACNTGAETVPLLR